MPIPKEFDCDEVRLNEEEIKPFRKAIVSINTLVENNKKIRVDVQKIYHNKNYTVEEADKIVKAEKAKAAAKEEAFWKNHKEDCKNGLMALKNPPEGRDPKSMLQWVKQFPYLLVYDNVDTYINKIGYDELFKNGSLTEMDYPFLQENFELAKSWYQLFSIKDRFEKIYGIVPIKRNENSGSVSRLDYLCEAARENLKKFQQTADRLGVMEKSEEELKAGNFDGVFDEVKDTVAKKQEAPKEQLIEEEIPKAAPKKEAPAEKEKIKPLGISKRIHLTEDVRTFNNKVNDFLKRASSLSTEITTKIKSNNFQNISNISTTSSAQLFEQNYGDVIQNEMMAMLAGPKEHSSDGALKWLETFPHLIAMIGLIPSLATMCLSGREDFSKEHRDLAREWYVFLKDGYPGRFESNLVIHTGAKADESFVQHENDLYNKAWAAVHKGEKMKIDSLVEKLENAKTFTNSDEYKQIISLSKMLYHADELPKKLQEQAGNTPESRHAFKLTTIKAQIDAYIDHKAKDGVKPNVYHKLAAVEELNRYVCEELNRIGVKNIPYDAPKSFKGDYAPTCLAEEKGDMAVKNYLPNESMAGAEKEECARALDCMGRILVHAGNLDVGFEKINALNRMANAFQAGSNVNLDAPQTEAAENTMDDPSENGVDLLG